MNDELDQTKETNFKKNVEKLCSAYSCIESVVFISTAFIRILRNVQAEKRKKCRNVLQKSK